MTTTPMTDSLARDPVKKDYVVRVPALVELRVPAEIYERVWKNQADEEGLDFSDAAALSAHAEKVGRASRWWDHSHASKTILPLPLLSPDSGPVSLPLAPTPTPKKEEQRVVPSPTRPTLKKEEEQPVVTKAELLEERLRIRARETAPSTWLDGCRTPIAPNGLPLPGSGDWQDFAQWAARKTRSHPRGIVLESLSPDQLNEVWKKGYRPDIGRLRNEEKALLEWLYDEWTAGRFQISEEATQEEYRLQHPSPERLELVASSVNGNGFH